MTREEGASVAKKTTLALRAESLDVLLEVQDPEKVLQCSPDHWNRPTPSCYSMRCE